MRCPLRTPCFCLVLCGVLGASASAQDRDVEIREAPDGGGGDRWAVLVGIDRYNNAEIAPATFADRDARELAATLQDVGGFAPENVKLLADGETGEMAPTRANILYWLMWLRKRADAADTVVFFFAGHGYDIDGEQYLLPIEADKREQELLDATCLKLSTVRGELDGIQSGRTVVFIDACSVDPRSDRAGGDNLMTAAFDKGLSGRARAVYYACDVGHRAYPRGDMKHGVFTHALLEGLRGKAAATDGFVDLSSLVSYVDARMAVWNRDHPDKEMTPRIDMQCTGRVVLSCPSTDLEPVPTTATLSVTGSPEGAQVFVDRRLRGVVPCDVTEDLGIEAERTVDVTATKPGYRSAGARVTLRRGEVSRWRVELERSYVIVTSGFNRDGPAYEAGMTPSALGWGTDDAAYPSLFVVNPVDGAEMAWVPAGEFVMGTTTDQLDRLWTDNSWAFDKPTDETAHAVRLTKGFWLYRHEVTNDQYAMFLQATGRQAHDQWEYCSHFGDAPVVLVTWDDSVAYSRWATGALPTEAQWEWAARGPEGRQFPWGDTWDRRKCCNAEFWAQGPINRSDAWQFWLMGTGVIQQQAGGLSVNPAALVNYPRPVGRYSDEVSWCGALDMAGNVCEWCGDWYGERYYGVSAAADPSGPVSGEFRVVRGGGWGSNATNCRSSGRLRNGPTERLNELGFRPVLAPR